MQTLVLSIFSVLNMYGCTLTVYVNMTHVSCILSLRFIV